MKFENLALLGWNEYDWEIICKIWLRNDLKDIKKLLKDKLNFLKQDAAILGSAFPNARYCKNTVRLDILTLLWAYDIEFKQDTAT